MLDNSAKSPFLKLGNHNENFCVLINKETNNQGDE